MKHQRKWVEKQLMEKGYVSRNEALANFISRLSGYTSKLKEGGWKIEGRYVKYSGGTDFRYYMTEKPTRIVQRPIFNNDGTVTLVPREEERIWQK